MSTDNPSKKSGKAEELLLAKEDMAASGGKQKNPKKKKKRSRAVRILFKALRIIFLWIPLVIIVLLFITLIAVDIFLSPARVEKLAVENFNKMSNGSLTLNVRKFSPYSDILIENIVIKNPPEFGGNLLEIQKFSFRYGLFSMLAGNVHFDEIGIYKPKIWLIQKKGIWNAAVLMKPGAPAKPEEKKPAETEKPKSEGPPKTEINLPISVSFLFNFILDDLRVYIKGDDFTTQLEGVTFKAKINVPPFKTIPLSPKAVLLLKDMDIVLDPEDRIDLSFYSKDASVEPPLILGWRLLFSKDDKGSTKFNSYLKVGTYKTPIRFRRAHLAPLDFMVLYDLYYDPIADHLRLNDFGVKFRDKRWISLEGDVSAVTKNPVIDIRMNQSQIALSDLYPYYHAITNDENMRFGGTISLAPLSIKGTPDNIAIRGNINLSAIDFKLPAFELSLPRADFSYSLDKVGERGKIGAALSMPDFFYTMDRSRSGHNGFFLKCDVDTSANFSRFLINSVDVRFYNPLTKENVLKIGIKGNAVTVPSVSGNIAINTLMFNKLPLVAMLPDSLKKTIEGIPLKKPVTGTVNTTFALAKTTDAKLVLSLKVPDFDVADLSLSADISQNAAKQRIDIRRVALEIPSRGLALNVKGFAEMKKPPLSDSDIAISLEMNYPKATNVYGLWNIAGKIAVNASMKGDLSKGKARGSVAIKNLSIKNPETMLFVDTVNLDFPFEYDFAFKPEAGSRIAVDKSSIIDTNLFKEKENFTIKGISAKHPVRNESFTYLKNLAGTLFFKKNAFEIQRLSATVLDGTILMKDTFF